MKKFYIFIIATFIVLAPRSFSQLLNPGFESETGTTITDWTDNGSGTESVGIVNPRTGNNALSYITSSTTNQAMVSQSSILVPDNFYVHIIGWAIGNNSNAEASLGTVMGSFTFSASAINIGTTLSRLGYSKINNQGSEQNAIVKLNSRSVSGLVTLYWDDIIVYSSAVSTADLVDPNFTGLFTATSNEVGTSITLTGIQGTDASSGVRGAVVLRANGLSQTPPELNDQGRYSTSGGGNGPNSIGSWTVIAVLEGVSTFVDNSVLPNSDYTYAAYIRDDAFNYSTSSTSNITSLPVELSSFSAFIRANAINLEWQTKTETNNYGFEIERASSVQGWINIGFVNGSGNSNSPKDYSFTDRSVTNGKYIYRLKQIDADGKYENSKEVEVDFGLPKTFSLGQNYPNPFNPATKINYTLPIETDVQLQVFTIEGEFVKSLLDQRQSAGVYSIQFDAANLASGTYLFRLNAGGFIQTKKMTLTK